MRILRCRLCDARDHNAKTCPERGKPPVPQVIVYVQPPPTSAPVVELRYPTLAEAQAAIMAEAPDVVWSKEPYYGGIVGTAARAIYLVEAGVAARFPGMYVRAYGSGWVPRAVVEPEPEILEPEPVDALERAEVAVAEEAEV